MSARKFIDTNILVYAFTGTEDVRHQTALDLLELFFEEDSASVNVQVLKEFYSVVTVKLKKPLSSREAISIIADLCHTFRVVDDTLGQLERALEIVEGTRISIWDAAIVAAAEAAGCNAIYTEDLSLKGFTGEVQIVNPFRR